MAELFAGYKGGSFSSVLPSMMIVQLSVPQISSLPNVTILSMKSDESCASIVTSAMIMSYIGYPKKGAFEHEGPGDWRKSRRRSGRQQEQRAKPGENAATSQHGCHCTTPESHAAVAFPHASARQPRIAGVS